MRRGYQHDDTPTRVDIVEWIVVTLILAIGFFALLQVVGEDVHNFVLSAWRFVVGLPR